MRSTSITTEERCAFLHLETQAEHEQFMEQFWFRRASDPDSPDNDFKIGYYRRIAFANENFGGQLAGWKTDRGRIHVLFGPPDSVRFHESGERTGIPPGQGPETYLSPTQEWYYPFIEGIGEKVVFDFEYSPVYGDYLLVRPASVRSGIPASRRAAELHATQFCDQQFQLSDYSGLNLTSLTCLLPST
jgi:GWxTD domain-containing protein